MKGIGKRQRTERRTLEAGVEAIDDRLRSGLEPGRPVPDHCRLKLVGCVFDLDKGMDVVRALVVARRLRPLLLKGVTTAFALTVLSTERKLGRRNGVRDVSMLDVSKGPGAGLAAIA